MDHVRVQQPNMGANVPAAPTVQNASGEPILISGLSVAGAVGATIAILDRLGAPVVEGDATLVTAFLSLFIIPLGTWFFARRRTVTVDKANAAIEVATAISPGTPVLGFSKGTSSESVPL